MNLTEQNGAIYESNVARSHGGLGGSVCLLGRLGTEPLPREVGRGGFERGVYVCVLVCVCVGGLRALFLC